MGGVIGLLGTGGKGVHREDGALVYVETHPLRASCVWEAVVVALEME